MEFKQQLPKQGNQRPRSSKEENSISKKFINPIQGLFTLHASRIKYLKQAISVLDQNLYRTNGFLNKLEGYSLELMRYPGSSSGYAVPKTPGSISFKSSEASKKRGHFRGHGNPPKLPFSNFSGPQKRWYYNFNGTKRHSNSIACPLAYHQHQGCYKGDEACDRIPETAWNQADNLSGRHANLLSAPEATRRLDATSNKLIPVSWSPHKFQEVHGKTCATNRVPGLHDLLQDHADLPASRESEEDQTRCQRVTCSTNSQCQGASQISGEDLSSGKSSSSSLQSPTGNGQLCHPNGLFQGRNCNKVQHRAQPDTEGSSGPVLVESQTPYANGAPIKTATLDLIIETDASNRGWGASCPTQRSRTGGLWPTQEASHHINYLELLAAFLAVKTFARSHSVILLKMDSISCSDLHQQDGWCALPRGMLLSSDSVGMVSGEADLAQSRPPPRNTECGSRRGVKGEQGQMRLEIESPSVHPTGLHFGSIGSGPLCLAPDIPGPTLLQLEAISESRSSGRIHSGLVSVQGIRKPSMVSDIPASKPCEKAGSTGFADCTTLENTPTLTRKARSDPHTNRMGVHHDSGSPNSSRMAHLREAFKSQGLSQSASQLVMSSWREKTTTNYNSLFKKWDSWCSEQNRNPFMGPIEDVNFLAELHGNGYQYRSYRSAISSAHQKVNGVNVGQHLLIS